MIRSGALYFFRFKKKEENNMKREEYMLEAMEHYVRFLQRKARDYER